MPTSAKTPATTANVDQIREKRTRALLIEPKRPGPRRSERHFRIDTSHGRAQLGFPTRSTRRSNIDKREPTGPLHQPQVEIGKIGVSVRLSDIVDHSNDPHDEGLPGAFEFNRELFANSSASRPEPLSQRLTHHRHRFAAGRSWW